MVKGFKCIGCGDCCRAIRKGMLYISTEDRSRWSNRPDILAWAEHWCGHETGEAGCPWLKGNECSIHDIKPDTCKGFPAKIGIAIKTKCNGSWTT